MLCPLCHQRKARRACPALGQQICTVCCGTKRLVEIRCPSDCAYLAAAREHPPAVVQKQQQRDFAVLLPLIQDLTERQSRLFFLLHSAIARHRPGDLHTLVDDDAVEAAGALAATYETSARGVIYEHRPASVAAERLSAELKQVLSEVGRNAGTSFERDATVALRRIERAARETRRVQPGSDRAFLALVDRVVAAGGAAGAPGSTEAESDNPRLIVP